MRSILILNALRIEIHEIKISRERRKTNKHMHAHTHTHTPTHTLAHQWAFVCRLLNAKYLIMLNN